MICLDFDKILTEVSWRLQDGIFDMKNDEHLHILRKVLTEEGAESSQIDDAIYRIKKQNEK